MSEEKRTFPDWDKPATKGDLLRVMVALRSLDVYAWQAVNGLHMKDDELMKTALEKFDAAWEHSDRVIADLGGYSESEI